MNSKKKLLYTVIILLVPSTIFAADAETSSHSSSGSARPSPSANSKSDFKAEPLSKDDYQRLMKSGAVIFVAPPPPGEGATTINTAASIDPTQFMHPEQYETYLTSRIRAEKKAAASTRETAKERADLQQYLIENQKMKHAIIAGSREPFATRLKDTLDTGIVIATAQTPQVVLAATINGLSLAAQDPVEARDRLQNLRMFFTGIDSDTKKTHDELKKANHTAALMQPQLLSQQLKRGELSIQQMQLDTLSKGSSCWSMHLTTLLSAQSMARTPEQKASVAHAIDLHYKQLPKLAAMPLPEQPAQLGAAAVVA